MIMAVYSYYYGAHRERGIGVQAQSKELEALPVRSALKDLSSMHALSSSEHDGEMLSYMLTHSGHTIIGASYIESPKSSGYSRSAPCGLMYVAPNADMTHMAGDLGKIINFISFQKPSTSSPAPLKTFPLNESGYFYHNSPSVLAPMIDGLVRVAFSTKDVLLVALPKGKNSDYASARYAIAEALRYLPASLRTSISFFTGLPVAENESDPLVGFDNAVKCGANVIFCPNEFFAKLRSHRSCIGLDMDQPTRQAGAFAEYITSAQGVSAGLSMISSNLTGTLSYDALNSAALRVRRGEVLTVEELQKELTQCKAQSRDLEKQLYSVNQEYADLQNKADQLVNQYNDLVEKYNLLRNAPYSTSDGTEDSGSSRPGKLFWIVMVVCAVALIALSSFATFFIATLPGGKDKSLPSPSPTAYVEVSPTPVPSPDPTESPTAPVDTELNG